MHPGLNMVAHQWSRSVFCELGIQTYGRMEHSVRLGPGSSILCIHIYNLLSYSVRLQKIQVDGFPVDRKPILRHPWDVVEKGADSASEPDSRSESESELSYL